MFAWERASIVKPGRQSEKGAARINLVNSATRAEMRCTSVEQSGIPICRPRLGRESRLSICSNAKTRGCFQWQHRMLNAPCRFTASPFVNAGSKFSETGSWALWRDAEVDWGATMLEISLIAAALLCAWQLISRRQPRKRKAVVHAPRRPGRFSRATHDNRLG